LHHTFHLSVPTEESKLLALNQSFPTAPNFANNLYNVKKIEFRVYTIQKEPIKDVQIIFDTRPYVHPANDSSANKIEILLKWYERYFTLVTCFPIEDEAGPQEDHVLKLATLEKAA
jgi:hypothetical protein